MLEGILISMLIWWVVIEGPEHGPEHQAEAKAIEKSINDK